MVFNKESLVESIAEEAGVAKAEANRQLDAVLNGLKTQLGKMEPGDRLQLVGKLTFEVVHKDARVGQNPRTKEPVNVPAKNKVKIKAGSELLSVIQ